MPIIDALSLLLVLFGALDLGLLGLTGYDMVAAIFGQYHNVASIIIGLCGLWQIRRQKFF